jgi:IS30 family transposase
MMKMMKTKRTTIKMPRKWIAINPLSIDERQKVKEGLDLDLSYSQLALHVGRCKSVVMREAKRLGKAEDYDPMKAQEDFEAKQKLIGKKKDVYGHRDSHEDDETKVVDNTTNQSHSSRSTP